MEMKNGKQGQGRMEGAIGVEHCGAQSRSKFDEQTPEREQIFNSYSFEDTF